jgi:methylenetetrahydrofolate reductase (NADPH)
MRRGFVVDPIFPRSVLAYRPSNDRQGASVRIRDRLYRDEPCLSFEFFPPKSPEGEAALLRTIEELAPLQPGYVSVTYGAGGSTRDRTVELVARIKRDFSIDPLAHLTCVGHDRRELSATLGRLADAGVDNILGLRGDPPRGQSEFQAVDGGLAHASDLIRFIRQGGYPFCIGGACYPEGHIECLDREVDLRNLKRKVEAGADFLVTQLFFDNAFYFDFVSRARAAGIAVPIVPGIMPITNFDQVERFTRMCGATVPMRLVLEMERRRNDPEATLELGVAHAVAQSRELMDRGAPGVHFYTLNRSPAARMIVTALRQRR